MDLINALKMFTLGPAYFKSILKDKRDIPRITCTIKAIGLIENKKVSLKIRDLSLRGLKIESSIKFAKDFTFPLTVESYTKFLASGDFGVKTLMVKVAWSRKKPDTDLYESGLTFIDSIKNIEDSWVYHIFNKFGEKRIISLQKRENIRVPTKIYVVCIDTKDRTKQGIIQNISMGGVMVKCKKEISVAETLELIIGPYKKFKTINLKGRVLRNSYFEPTDHWLIAIEFMNMSSKDYKNIGKLILAILKDIENEER